MTTPNESGTNLATHLHRALETAENGETRYELREALQKCHLEDSAEVDPAAALDN